MVECLFFFNDTATTEIYTLSLHDALPISLRGSTARTSALIRSVTVHNNPSAVRSACCSPAASRDRKSTRLNSSHLVISYAVFCLKKKMWPIPRATSQGLHRRGHPLAQ